MRRRDFVRAAAGATLPLARAARAADREPPEPGRGGEPPVATLALHYMTWLQQRSWPLASTWPVLRNPAYPLPRGYDSDDSVVFRAHNRAAERHGFAWLWSWWGQASVPGGDPTLRRYLDLDPGATVPLIVLYEATEILAPDRDGFFNFNDPANFRRFVEDVAYLDRAYWSNPHYAHRFLRVDGRPVLFAWVSRNFTGTWPAAVEAARQRASFYLVGSEFLLDLRPDGRPLVRDDLAEALLPLDAVSGYGIYDPRYVPSSGRLDAGYASRYEQALRGWAELVTSLAPGCGSSRRWSSRSTTATSGRRPATRRCRAAWRRRSRWRASRAGSSTTRKAATPATRACCPPSSSSRGTSTSRARPWSGPTSTATAT